MGYMPLLLNIITFKYLMSHYVGYCSYGANFIILLRIVITWKGH